MYNIYGLQTYQFLPIEGSQFLFFNHFETWMLTGSEM